MANFKVPRVVRIVDDLPLNASGKVLKTELRATASAHDARRPKQGPSGPAPEAL
jgi:acyl-CoA synthetase (AMP-forming)/AMP-acid ligase II